MSIEVVYARANASPGLPGGGQVSVRVGQHWPADDPIVAQYPELFSPVPFWGLSFTRKPKGFDDPPVETATAAPGERRSSTRARS